MFVQIPSTSIGNKIAECRLGQKFDESFLYLSNDEIFSKIPSNQRTYYALAYFHEIFKNSKDIEQ